MNKSIDKILWFLAIEIIESNCKGIYSVFYRSPSATVNIENSLDELDTIFENVINLNKMNIKTGDLNIDLNIQSRLADLFKNIIAKHGIVQKIDFKTGENDNNGTIIDVVLTNDHEKVKTKPLENEIITDHKTIIIQHENNEKEEVKTVHVISWKNYTKDKLIDNLGKCNWSKFYTSDIDDKVKLLRENLISAVIPLTHKIHIKNNIPKTKKMV